LDVLAPLKIYVGLAATLTNFGRGPYGPYASILDVAAADEPPRKPRKFVEIVCVVPRLKKQVSPANTFAVALSSHSRQGEAADVPVLLSDPFTESK
jgi:hypothetical protein